MFVHPDTYALPGDTITSRINKMFDEAPLGSYCFIPGGYGVLTRTPGTDYYLRSRRSISIVSNANHRNPIEYDSSGAGVADVLLIEPDSPEAVQLQTEISGLKFNPVTVQLMDWSPTDPRCSWARDIVRINARAGFGVAKLYMHDCYAPFGTGWGFNFIGLSGHAGVFSSRFDGLWTSGGMRLDHIGDSMMFTGCRLEGKSGLEYRILDGASEILFEQFQISPSAGPAVYGRGGTKVTMRQIYIEQKGWDRPGLPKAIMDLRHHENPTQFNTMMNALTLDGLSVLSQSGVPMDQLILIGNAIQPILRRINYYAIDGAVNAVKFDDNCLYPRLEGPFTYYGNFSGPKVDCPSVTRPYCAEAAAMYWGAPFSTQNGVRIFKNSDGQVSLSGVAECSTPPSPGTVMFGVPDGFRSLREEKIYIPTDTGYAICRIPPQTSDADGHPVSLEQITPGNATKFYLAGMRWMEWRHMNGIETNN